MRIDNHVSTVCFGLMTARRATADVPYAALIRSFDACQCVVGCVLRLVGVGTVGTRCNFELEYTRVTRS